MLSKRIKRLSPYVAGEQPKDRTYIKLNTNENPYPPSPETARYLKSLDPADLRLYPDPTMSRLRNCISRRESLEPENIFMGNGSDEVLSFLFYALFDSVIFPEITYSFYPVYCSFYGIPYETVPLKNNFGIDLQALAKTDSEAGIIFANPNSPTGMYLEKKEISSFLEKTAPNRAIVIDEAYIDFGGETCADLLNRHENLVIVRTFSKSHSLAGIRLGYALANRKVISTLFTVKDSFNSYPVHTVAQELGLRALEDEEGNRDVCEKIISTRDRVSRELEDLGFRVLPSKANFIFLSSPLLTGKEIYQKLRDRGILVRYFGTDRLKDFVRVTIGTDDQMTSFINEIKKCH